MATLILTSGIATPVTPKNGKTFTLDEVQALVGGYVELLHLPNSNLVAYCNEDGKMEHLLPNDRFSRLYGDFVVGDVVMGTKKELGL